MSTIGQKLDDDTAARLALMALRLAAAQREPTPTDLAANAELARLDATQTQQQPPATTRAAEQGWCSKCHSAIFRGQKTTRRPGQAWTHAVCPKKP